jgi:hypothetical protein
LPAKGRGLAGYGGPRYGPSHRSRRAELAPLVASGCVTCARCGELIAPTDRWDLGHVEGDPYRYAGPEHERCNRRTSSHRVQRLTSRDWLGSG